MRRTNPIIRLLEKPSKNFRVNGRYHATCGLGDAINSASDGQIMLFFGGVADDDDFIERRFSLPRHRPDVIARAQFLQCRLRNDRIIHGHRVHIARDLAVLDGCRALGRMNRDDPSKKSDVLRALLAGTRDGIAKRAIQITTNRTALRNFKVDLLESLMRIPAIGNPRLTNLGREVPRPVRTA